MRERKRQRGEPPEPRIPTALTEMPEVYRRDRSYLWNYRNGPRYAGPRTVEIPGSQASEFFGKRIAVPVGVAAGLLLNSRWIECFARIGYGILTYKTVRSAPRPSYPLPNWVIVEPPRGGLRTDRDQVLRRAQRRPRRASEITSAVCFGMPSMAPEVWRRDVRRARRVLGRDRFLAVSVVGTPQAAGGWPALAEDYARCARWAAEAGADAVEANLSCPNVDTAEGAVYHDAGRTRELCRLLREVLPSTPLFLKVGYLGDAEALRRFYRAVAGLADAVVLVNGIARRVVDDRGRPVFPGHPCVGILGRALHAPAVRCVAEAVRVSRSLPGAPATLAVGGVLAEEDAEDFFDAGASAVLLGGAPSFDPLLGSRIAMRLAEGPAAAARAAGGA